MSAGEARHLLTVLFACVQNAGRSQMAAAIFNQLADPSQARALSAGTQPARQVHQEVAAAMADTGVDISRAQPRLLTPELAREADLLVTLGCGEACPHIAGLRRLDWSLPDPHGQDAPAVRRIRDTINSRVRDLLRAEGIGAAGV